MGRGDLECGGGADCGGLGREERNILRLMFSGPRVKTAQEDWQSVAHYVVGPFRADAARAGAGAKIVQLV